MEGNTSDLQVKYQKLAAEYSKLRSQAQVLKKGVVDEQTKNSNLTELLKEYEQKVRKADLEMESLNFRNQQLTKRIIVLQEELEKQAKQKHKGNKHASNSSSDIHTTNAVIDEELMNKIVENAQLLSTISDKEVIITTLEDRIRDLESQLEAAQTCETQLKEKYEKDIKKLKSEISELNSKVTTANDVIKQLKMHNGETRSDIASLGSEDTAGSSSVIGDTHSNEQLTQAKQQILALKQELEMYKAKCKSHLFEINDENKEDIIKASGDTTNLLGAMSAPSVITFDEIRLREKKLTEYFLERINELVREKEYAESLNDNIVIECNSLEVRLEESIKEKEKLEERLRTTELALERLQEELSTTSHNYELQLSTMSEHLANLNDTLTKQCDEIQQLEYNLSLKRHNK